MSQHSIDMRKVTVVAAAALLVATALWVSGVRGTVLALFIAGAVSVFACGLGARPSKRPPVA